MYYNLATAISLDIHLYVAVELFSFSHVGEKCIHLKKLNLSCLDFEFRYDNLSNLKNLTNLDLCYISHVQNGDWNAATLAIAKLYKTQLKKVGSSFASAEPPS